MKQPTPRARSRLLTAGVWLALAVAAFAPGSWSTAVAQTGGGDESGSSTPVSAPPPGTPTTPTTPTTPSATTPTTPVQPPPTPVVAPPASTTANTPPPPPLTRQIDTTTTTTVSAPAAGLSLSLPPGATGNSTTVTVAAAANAMSAPTSPAAQASISNALNDISPNNPPAGVQSGNSVVVSVFSLDLSGSRVAALRSSPGGFPGAGSSPIRLGRSSIGGTSVVAGLDPLAKEVVITLPVTPEMLALAGGETTNISLQYFDVPTKQWSTTGVRPIADPRPLAVSFGISHFSDWALVVRKPAPPPPPVIIVPTTPGGPSSGPTAPPQEVVPAPAKTGTGLPPVVQSASLPWVPVVLVVLTLSVLGTFAARRRN